MTMLRNEQCLPEYKYICYSSHYKNTKLSQGYLSLSNRSIIRIINDCIVYIQYRKTYFPRLIYISLGEGGHVYMLCRHA